MATPQETKRLGLRFLPKVDRNYSWVQLWDACTTGSVKGMLAFGMNGVANGPNSKKKHRRPEKSGLPGGRRNLSG